MNSQCPVSYPLSYHVTIGKQCYVSLRRCVVGDDWSYYGDRCQFKSSIQNGVVTAVVSTVVVFVVMLVVIVVIVVCLKKKYKKKMNDMGGGTTTQNNYAS